MNITSIGHAVALWARTFGAYASLPATIILFSLAAGSAVGWLRPSFPLHVAYVVLLALMLLLPLAGFLMHLPGETFIERRFRLRQAVHARAQLARFGLTPESYLATIPKHAWLELARAKVWLGIETGKPKRHLRLVKSTQCGVDSVPPKDKGPSTE